MRDLFTIKQEECLVILRSMQGIHILNAPLDMTDAEALDMLCAAQHILTERMANPPKGDATDESTNTTTDLQ